MSRQSQPSDRGLSGKRKRGTTLDDRRCDLIEFLQSRSERAKNFLHEGSSQEQVVYAAICEMKDYQMQVQLLEAKLQMLLKEQGSVRTQGLQRRGQSINQPQAVAPSSVSAAPPIEIRPQQQQTLTQTSNSFLPLVSPESCVSDRDLSGGSMACPVPASYDADFDFASSLLMDTNSHIWSANAAQSIPLAYSVEEDTSQTSTISPSEFEAATCSQQNSPSNQPKSQKPNQHQPQFVQTRLLQTICNRLTPVHREFFSSSDLPQIVFAPNLRILDCNQAFMNTVPLIVFGPITSQEFLSAGLSVLDLDPPERYPMMFQFFHQLLELGTLHIDGFVFIRDPEITGDISVSAIYDTNQNGKKTLRYIHYLRRAFHVDPSVSVVQLRRALLGRDDPIPIQSRAPHSAPPAIFS